MRILSTKADKGDLFQIIMAFGPVERGRAFPDY